MAYDGSKNTALMGVCDKPSKNKMAVALLKWDVLTAPGQHLGMEMHISTVLLVCTCLPTA